MQLLAPLPTGSHPVVWYPGGTFSANDLAVCSSMGNGTSFVRNNAGNDGIEIYTNSTWIAVAPETALIIQDTGPSNMSYAAYAVQFHFAGLSF